MTGRRILANLLMFLAYLLTANFGLTIGPVNGFATLIWPPAGLALAAMMILGYSVWPSVALAAFFINYGLGGQVLPAVGIAIGNTLEPLLIAYTLNRTKTHLDHPTVNRVLIFLVAVVAFTFMGATIGVGNLWLSRSIPKDQFQYTWLAWWFGDMMANYVVAPVVIAVYHRFSIPKKLVFHKVFEGALLGVLLFLFSGMIFLDWLPSISEYTGIYIFFPILVWSAARFGQVGATTTIFYTVAVAVWATTIGRGPFVMPVLSESLIYLHTFATAFTFCGLLLGAFVTELRAAEKIVRRRKEELERLVVERTKELIHANEELQRNKAMLDEAQRITKIGSWEWDVKTDKVLWSNQMTNVLELEPSTNLTVRAYLELLEPTQKKVIEDHIQYAFKHKRTHPIEYWIKDKAGKRKHLRTCGSVVLDKDGNVVKMIGTTQDITEMKHREEELHRAKLEAERANQAKSTFLTNMSHEIRTPLGIVLGFSELMIDPNEPLESRKNFAKTIQKNGLLLSDLINDILDLAKVESGKIEANVEEVNLREFLEDTRLMLEPRAHGQGLELGFHIGASAPSVIRTDPRQLRQILVNVIGNSLKFTEHGRIDITIHMVSSTPGQELLALDVADTGIGMNKKQQRKIFEPFYQADDGSTRKFGGTGIGLTLSKHLAANLGGDLILLRSEPNKGSEFRIVIQPNMAISMASNGHNGHNGHATEHGHRKFEALVLKKKSILLVEDSIDNQNLVTHFLRSTGARVDVAKNGAEGLEKALTGGYDVVLMDIQMPILDGIQATIELRKKGFKKPIIALTAHALSEERRHCFEVGFSDYLSKPITKASLIEHVATMAEST